MKLNRTRQAALTTGHGRGRRLDVNLSVGNVALALSGRHRVPFPMRPCQQVIFTRAAGIDEFQK